MIKESLLALLFLAPAVAQEPTINDFAEAVEFTFVGGPVIRLPMPDEVYSGVVHSNLSDVRLFNSRGDVVPFDILDSSDLSLKKPEPDVFEPLPLVSVQVTDPNAVSQTVRLETDMAGKVRGIKIQEGEQKPADGEPASTVYVVDMRTSERVISKMRFEWEGARDGRFIPVKVESSQDLQNWNFVNDGVLIDTSTQGQTLVQREISFTPERKTAYRVTLQVPPSVAKLTKLEGVYVRGEQPEKAMQKKHAMGTNENGEVIYDSGGYFPVRALQLLLPPGSAAAVAISSSDKREGPWVPRTNATVFNFSTATGDSRSKEVEIEGVRDRYWKLQIQGAGEQALANPPSLEFQWRPEEVVFVQNGESPYRLAFGSAIVKARAQNATTIRDQVNQQLKANLEIAVAAPLKTITLGGPEKREMPKEDPVKRALLPGILALAILLIAHQAWRLIKEMKSTPPAA